MARELPLFDPAPAHRAPAHAISIAVGAGLVSLIDFHLIFGIVGLVTGVGAAYLVVALRPVMGHAVPSLDEAPEVPEEIAKPSPPIRP